MSSTHTTSCAGRSYPTMAHASRGRVTPRLFNIEPLIHIAMKLTLTAVFVLIVVT